MAAEEEQTDTFQIPSTTQEGSRVPVVLKVEGTSQEGSFVSVTDDQITVVVASGVPLDTQVDVAGQGVQSIGMVVWSRLADERTAMGIEIIGGADEWRALLANG